MDLTSKKLELLDWLMHINDMKLLLQIEKLKQQLATTASEKSTLNFSWEGGLKELKNDFDGVKLQHHINILRK